MKTYITPLATLLGIALAASSEGQGLYAPTNFTDSCSQNPYALRGYEDRNIPTTVVLPPLFDTYGTRLSIAQGAVGTEPATERAYLVLSNLEDRDQLAGVRLTVEGLACPVYWQGTVGANGRASIGLHADPRFAGKRLNFSVVVVFEGAGDADLVNYDGRQVETATKPGKVVPR